MKQLEQIIRVWKLRAWRPDIALSRDESTRFLPWIVALMIYLAALTLAGGLTLNRTINAAGSAGNRDFSIHIPASAKSKDITDKALTLVQQTDGVKTAEVMDVKKMESLVEPWLGKSSSLENLPLPTIIEVQIKDNTDINLPLLASRLQGVAPGTEIDDHKQWAEQFTGFVHKVQWMLFTVSLVIMSTTTAVVVFASKMSLKIHRGTVNLLHRLGAYDTYIASQFQQHAALLTLKGAFVGSGLAAGTLIILHVMAEHIRSPLFPSFAMTFSHWGILVGLPFLMSVIALLSTRISVLSTLARIP